MCVCVRARRYANRASAMYAYSFQLLCPAPSSRLSLSTLIESSEALMYTRAPSVSWSPSSWPCASTLPLERARSHEQIPPGEPQVVHGRVFGLQVSDLLELARVVAGLGICGMEKSKDRPKR